MTNEAERFRERTVDCLQNIYAVVIALAVAQAFEGLLKDPTSGTLLRRGQIIAGLPAFTALLVTLVPFWHGMNRHLDRCYLEKKGVVKHGGLLFDFAIFLVEAGLLFAAGWSLSSGITTFIALGLLLLLDMVWGLISHLMVSYQSSSDSSRGTNCAVWLSTRNNHSDGHRNRANGPGLFSLLGLLLSVPFQLTSHRQADRRRWGTFER